MRVERNPSGGRARVGVGAVEKLEQILHAEDAARTTVENARTRAAGIVGEARAAASEALRVGVGEAREHAEAIRGEMLAQARAQAVALEAEAARESAEAIAIARKRTGEALAVVVSVVRGR